MRQQSHQGCRQDCTRKVSGHAIPFFLFFGGAIANAEEPIGVVCQSDSDCSRALVDRAMCVHDKDASLTHGICQKSGHPDNDSNIVKLFRRSPQTPACSDGDCFASSTWPTKVLAAQKKSGKKSKSGKAIATPTVTATHSSTPSSRPENITADARSNLPNNASDIKSFPTEAIAGHNSSANPLQDSPQVSIDGKSSLEQPVSRNDGMWIGIGASAVIALLAMGVIFAFASRVRRVRNSEYSTKETSYDDMPVGFESFSKHSTSADGKVAFTGGQTSYCPSNASLHSSNSTRSYRSFGNMSSTSSVTVRNPIFHPVNDGKHALQPSDTLRDSSSSRSNNSTLSSKSRDGQRTPGRIQTPAIANVPPSLPVSTGVWTPAREFRRPMPPLAGSKGRFVPEDSRSLISSSASSSSGSSHLTTSSINVSMESSTSSQAPSLISSHTGVSINPLPVSPFLLTQADRIAIADRNKVRMFLHGLK